MAIATGRRELGKGKRVARALADRVARGGGGGGASDKGAVARRKAGVTNVVICGGEFQAEETASAKVPGQE